MQWCRLTVAVLWLDYPQTLHLIACDGIGVFVCCEVRHHAALHNASIFPGQEALSCIDSFAGLLADLCVSDCCLWRYMQLSSALLR